MINKFIIWWTIFLIATLKYITIIMYVQCKTEKHILNMASKSIAKNIYNLRSVKKNEKYFCEVDRTYAQIENWKSSLAFYLVRPTCIFFYNTLIQETKTAIPTSVQSFKKRTNWMKIDMFGCRIFGFFPSVNYTIFIEYSI